MTLGIKAVTSFIPENRINNIELAAKFGQTQAFVDDKLGARILPRKTSEQETSDLCVAAIKKMQLREDFCLNDIEALVVVTQNGDGEHLPHTAAIVQRKLNIPTKIAAFDVSLGCSGYVYGLYILSGLMAAAGLNQALLVTADPYSKIINPDDRATSMLFGDAATATWITKDAIFRLGPVGFGTDGNGAEFLQVNDGLLSMNGRQVFNFAAMHVPTHIKSLLSDNNLTEGDIDAFLIHQGSAAIVDAVSRKFAEPGKFIKDLAETGNTVSSTIPLLIEKYALQSQWRNIVLSGFGVGFSWASALLHRE